MAERRDRGIHGYADYAVENYRPSKNVENRARRGMNGTGQTWAIKTQHAEDELRRFAENPQLDRPYTAQDVADWHRTSGYKGYGNAWNLDKEVYSSKLANAAGVNTNSEFYQADYGKSYPEITEEMYRRPPPAAGYVAAAPADARDYNGGKPEFAGGGAVRRLLGALSTTRKDVPGKPSTVKIPGYDTVYADPIDEVQGAADSYMRKVGRPGEHHVDEYEKFDEERAARIAEAFERMQHNPGDPEVRRSYDAMISETLDQYESLKDAGVDFRFLKEGMDDPYAKSPALGYADVVENGRLWVFPTDQGFGTINEIADNPLLKRVGKIGDLENATANDAFRAVHDMYGHFGPGNPFFRHQGEERAWVNHSKMYSPDALPAMTSETRGQNSWLNFGPHGEHNRTALGADTVFADQKIGLLPAWTYGKEGYAAGGPIGGTREELLPEENDLTEPAMFLGRAARKLPYILKGENGADLKHEMLEARRWDPKDAEQFERKVWSDNAVGMNRDNQMMFEIDDSNARLLELPDFGPDRKQFENYEEYSQASRAWQDAGGKMPTNIKLGDVLDHPELYEQYGNLPGLSLKLSPLDEGHYGSLNSTGDQVDYMTINRRLAEGDMLDTILHETQHAIQTQEGWTKGTSPDITRFAVGAVDREMNRAAQVAQAQMVLQRGQDPGLLMSYDMFKGISPNELGQILHEAKTLHPDEVQAILQDVRKRKENFPDAHTVYERNEGEVMARNTSSRRELTMPERYQSFWRESEDRQGEPRFVGSDGRIEW